MSQNKLNRPVSVISVYEDAILPGYVIEALNIVGNNEGFLPERTIKAQTCTNIGDDIAGTLYKVIIIGLRIKNNITTNDKLILICKIPPINSSKFSTMKLFEREILMYSELLPILEKFQLDKNVSKDEGFFSYPKCLYTFYNEDKGEALIILEDMKEKGFNICNKYLTASYTEIRKVMISLGRFHAVSFAMKEQQPELFKKCKLLNNTPENFSDTAFQSLITTNCDRAINSLEQHEEFKRSKVEKFKEELCKKMSHCTNGDLSEPYSVLTHGDCWINNIMYFVKSDSLYGDICLLDWQTSRYSTPVLDLLYYIFSSTDITMREQSYDNFIQIYHKSLTSYLDRLGGDASRQFPMTALLRQLKTYGQFALGISIFLIPILCDEDNTNFDIEQLTDDMKKDPKLIEQIIIEQNHVKYNIRMNGIIRDIIRLGYL